MLGPRRPWCTPDAAHADEESTGRIVDRLVVPRCTDVASTTRRTARSAAARRRTPRAVNESRGPRMTRASLNDRRVADLGVPVTSQE